MKSTSSQIQAKKILLISTNENLLKVFNELCENKEFVICQTVTSLDKLVLSAIGVQFDVIVASSTVSGKNSVEFFAKELDNEFEHVPVVIQFPKSATIRELELIKEIHAEIVFENNLNIPFLNHLLKTAIEKKLTLHLLKENSLRYQSLYDHSLDINLIINNDAEIIDSNVQGRKKIKFISNLPLVKIFKSKEDYTKFIDLLREVEQVSRFQTVIRLKKKLRICLLDAFTIYNSNLEVDGAHILIRDIDEKTKSQNLANQAGKLMVTGKFVRSLAHEIRNPLTNVNLALNQIEQENSLDDDAKLYVDILQRSTHRISTLLDEIMNAYKNSELDLKPNKLHNIIDNAIRFANDRLMLKKINLKLNLKVKDDALMADKLKLGTAILNLIVNASEAISHDQGKIEIYTSKSNNQLILKIKDNGCGMNETQIKTLFDPFYTGKSKGLGLGLTTAQNVIFAHGGSIQVESKENKGTSFLINLPTQV